MKKGRAGMVRILGKVLQDIKPGEHELALIKEMAGKFMLMVQGELKNRKIAADAFIGGSLAKGTLLKREKYDIDIFIRFDYKKYLGKETELSGLLEGVLEKVFLKFKSTQKDNSSYNFSRVHGSRDYFHIKFHNKKIRLGILFEVVPVLAVSKPNKAVNVTDLSFFHVNYVKKQISKKKSIGDDILLAKAFCYANNCYGAESHIRGFSGYALELLVIHYGGFAEFVNATIGWEDKCKHGKKIIIDSSKHYKKAEYVLLEMNESKLISPVIVVDPTYPVRNATAAVSAESLAKFIKACRKFNSKPSLDSFMKQEINVEGLKKIARAKKSKFCMIEIVTSKAKEDIAASKMLKFFNFLVYLLEKNGFKIVFKEIKFNGKKGIVYIIYKIPQSKMLIIGPPMQLEKHVSRFRRKYRKTFSSNGRICAYGKRGIKDIKSMVEYARKSQQLGDMSITGLRVIKN